MKTCKQCNGTGKAVNFSDSLLENSGILFEKSDCKVCNGSGYVKEEYYEWYSEMLDFITGHLNVTIS